MYVSLAEFISVKGLRTSGQFREAARARIIELRRRMEIVRKWEFSKSAPRLAVYLSGNLDDGYCAEYAALLNAVAYVNLADYGDTYTGYAVTAEQEKALNTLQMQGA